MNTRIINEIYKVLSNYVINKSKYEPRVLKKALRESDKFPLIVLMPEDDTNNLITTNFEESIDDLKIDIEIYAQDKAFENKIISNVNIVEELEKLVDYIMSKKFKMRRIECKPIPNLDNSIYRVRMKYIKKIISNKKILI